MKRNPIIVALDVPDAEQALGLVEKLQPLVGGFKVGSQLFTSAGPEVVRRINAAGGRVFLDLKWHDIPHTVAKAVEAAVRLDIFMCNVHASGGLVMMAAAEAAARETANALGITPPLVLAVTVLTSLDDQALSQIGCSYTVAEEVERLAELAADAELRGLICSPQEVAGLRRIMPPKFQLVTPGIRLPEAGNKDDQKRTGMPKQALDDGADWLVIGRPIYGAEDPRQAAEEILKSLNLN